jgi:hypothetical protein
MLDLSAAALSRVLYVTREDLAQHRALLCDVWGFRVIGVRAEFGDTAEASAAKRIVPAAGPAARRWVLVRPGLQRPLEGMAHRARLVLVFDLNGVLGAKWFDPGAQWRVRRHCHARCGAVAFVLRPGASKLIRVCESAGHEVWLWSTMQRATVEACARILAPWLPPGRVLSRDDCPAPDTKDLRKVWAQSALQGPDLAARTLLFDDDLAKGRLQPECVRLAPLFAPRDPYDTEAVADVGALNMLSVIARAMKAGERSEAGMKGSEPQRGSAPSPGTTKWSGPEGAGAGPRSGQELRSEGAQQGVMPSS